MAVLIVGTCAALGAGGTASGAKASTPVASAVCATGARSVCATQSANGHTVTAPVGWTVDISLHARDRTWSAPSEFGPRLLRQIGRVHRSVGGVEATYKAVALGRTELRALARPTCLPSQACPQFVLVWAVHLVVIL